MGSNVTHWTHISLIKQNHTELRVVRLASKVMDPHLYDAARSGTAEFLQSVVASGLPSDYFLSQHRGGRNFLHTAVTHKNVHFVRTALDKLPTPVVIKLLSQRQDTTKSNPLHVASNLNDRTIVQLILDYYKSQSSTLIADIEDDDKPWIAQDNQGRTPLHRALYRIDDDCAAEILSIDAESQSSIVDKEDNSPLFLAVKYDCKKVALAILKNSRGTYKLNGRDGLTPLHLIPKCSGEVRKELLQKHGGLLKEKSKTGYTVPHYWLEIGGDKVWAIFKEVLEHISNTEPQWKDDFVAVLFISDLKGNNLLHIAADKGNVEVAKGLVEVYKNEKAKLNTAVPWLVFNENGITPVCLAINKRNEDVAMCYMSMEINTILHQGNDNVFFQAIELECFGVANAILNIQRQHGWSARFNLSNGRNILHDASKYSEKVAAWLIDKLPSFIEVKDNAKKTPLDVAAEEGASWLVELMLKKQPSSLKKAPFAWVKPCQEVAAFLNHCSYFREHCLKKQDSPLHHINLDSYDKYQSFLKNQVMDGFLNLKDSSNRDTPLHKAVINKDIHLAEALLTKDGVKRTVKNKQKRTPLHFLATLCRDNEEWEEMRKRNGIELKAAYFKEKTNLIDARNTLSVVAALLATITFTAGFTLPGGFNQSGEAVLGDNAAFVVFMLADVFAMCCSMLVLVFLIWSMVIDENKSTILIDRSVPILIAALQGTLVAFMTGVYAVMAHKTLWVAIIILVMCIIVMIVSPERNFLYNVSERLSPSTLKDKLCLMEEGRLRFRRSQKRRSR